MGGTPLASGAVARIHELRLVDRQPSEDLTHFVEATDDDGALIRSTEATFRMAPEPGSPFRMNLGAKLGCHVFRV